MIFENRQDAGFFLAERLEHYKGRKDVVVLALPRGGVVTGYQIAGFLKAPLDVLIVRKLGFPGESELAIGAVAETGAVVLNPSIIDLNRVPDEYIRAETERQKQEIARQVELYRGGAGIIEMKNKTVVLVDDGVATGATMKAAIEAVKREGVAKIVIALPVSPPETAAALRNLSDEFVCINTPYNFMAVGFHYKHFDQVSDKDVIELLHRSAARAA